MNLIKDDIIEEIISIFGRTGDNARPRIRKFHAEILFNKFLNNEKVISQKEIDRPKDYLDRIIKYSQGYLEYSNEELQEIKINSVFFGFCKKLETQYRNIEELDHSDNNLSDQGIIIKDNHLTFDGRLNYSKFYKIISDESESMNDPKAWLFNDVNIEKHEFIDFSDKSHVAFCSKLFLLKMYILRKIDDVAFVTSRFVFCPACNSNYIVAASKIDFQSTYRCEMPKGDRKCGTVLKKFTSRKMIPTHIYEIAILIKMQGGFEYREFFLESFTELDPGFYTVMCFGRTENKNNSVYFVALTAKEDKGKKEFVVSEDPINEHKFFNITQSVVQHIKKIGFVINDEQAQLPVIIETIKKLTLIVNKEINLDHSLYFGAPGIGKTYALTLLHHMFYSNSGFISGPRFTLAGLTGGQKEVYYQDACKKKNVTGLFSNQAFVFDEINNAQFLLDDKSINLFKSAALAASGTSSTVGGKEFPRIALISATANYNVENLLHYENKIKKLYNELLRRKQGPEKIVEQENFLSKNLGFDESINIPFDFDFYAPLKDYDVTVSNVLKTAILRVRDEGVNYLTNFPKPLMERFYWSVLVHPKYDHFNVRQKLIDVEKFLIAGRSVYTQRELITQLYVPDFDKKILELIRATRNTLETSDLEKKWSKQAQEFIADLTGKYPEFFHMFTRLNQVHIYVLYTLSLINQETELSFATKRIFERLVSLVHTPILMADFHNPNFKNYSYLGETRGELLELIKRHPDKSLDEFLDIKRSVIPRILAGLEKDKLIEKIDQFKYRINNDPKFEKITEDMK